MSVKNKLLTTVAALSLMGGAAVAQNATTEQPTTEMSQSEYAPGWNENMDSAYGDIADRQVAELVGMNVVTEGGDDVGEVDNFVLMQDRIQAVVGVGGFLGLGEHEVALPLDELKYDGEKLIIAYTEDELKAMPEYTEELEQTAFNEGDTFRTRTMPADQSTDTAAAEGDATMSTDENADQTVAEGDATMSTEENADQTVAEGDAATATEENADQTVAEGDAATDEDSTAMDMADGTMESDADEAGAPSGEDVAAAEDAAGGEDTMTEEVAEEQKGEIEQEAEEIAAETDQAVTEGSEEVADAAEATGDAVEEGADNAEQMAENAGDAVEEGAEDAAQTAENAAEETGDAIEEGANDVADATDNAAENVEQGAENVADAASAEVGTWDEQLQNEFAQIADAPVADIKAFPVVTAEGENIGEIEDLARQNDKVVALVGVGGFLGIGEHNVALELSELSFDGEKFIAEGYTEEDLKAMPEYNEDSIERIEGDVTLRSAL